jgi:hypothetical protein
MIHERIPEDLPRDAPGPHHLHCGIFEGCAQLDRLAPIVSQMRDREGRKRDLFRDAAQPQEENRGDREVRVPARHA